VSWRIVDGAAPIVTSITPGSQADKAGLQVGDQINSFQGMPIPEENTFRQQLLAAVGECIFEITRTGEAAPLTIRVTPQGNPIRVGMTWREDDGEPGVMLITQIIPGSAAEIGGLKLKDRIYSLNEHTFATGKDFSSLMSTVEAPLAFVVERSGKLQTIKIQPLVANPPTPQ
jgi:S1-C subfamily serine protease